LREGPLADFLDVQLADYAERCEDYRRQCAYYPKIVFLLVAILSTTLGWMVGTGRPADYLWILPISVVVCEAVAVFSVFVFWSSRLMRDYIIEIERALNFLAVGKGKIHSTDEDREPEIAFGYHYWTTKNPLLKKRRGARKFASALLAAIFSFLLWRMWALGIDHRFYVEHRSAALVLGGAALFAPLFGIVGYLWARRNIAARHASQDPFAGEGDQAGFPATTGVPPSLSESDSLRILVADFEQRNDDFRRIADNYAPFLTLLLTVLAGSVSIYLPGGNEWVFAVAPVLLATIPFFIVTNYRALKPLKQYIMRLEEALDAASARGEGGAYRPHALPTRGCGAGGEAPDAGGYRVGFFRVIREKYFQRADGSEAHAGSLAVAGPAILVFLLLLAISVARSYPWVRSEHPELLAQYVAVVAATVVIAALDAWLYFEAKTVARDDKDRR